MKTKEEKEQLRKEFKEQLKAIPQEKKSKVVLYWESLEKIDTSSDFIDMRAILR
jgi:hypothetical protein